MTQPIKAVVMVMRDGALTAIMNEVVILDATARPCHGLRERDMGGQI